MQSCLSAAGAAIWRSASRATASVRNVMRCGSVWECAPCSFKVSAGRAAEVLSAIDGCQAVGGSVLLVTLTFPHRRTDDASDLVARLSDAWERVVKHRRWRSALDAAGVHGTVRALEITWGQANGWHPHLHVLVFADRLVVPESLRAPIFDLWRAACVAAGLPAPSERYGVDVRGGERAAGYVAKWGLHTEVALSALKKGRGDRYTPWELLAQLDHTGHVVWRNRWRAYLAAVHRSKQLVWSRGLKARYGVGEVSDDEHAANGGDADEVLWRSIPPKLWSAIYRAKLIGQFLALAGAGDRLGFEILLAGVLNKPQRDLGKNLHAQQAGHDESRSLPLSRKGPQGPYRGGGSGSEYERFRVHHADHGERARRGGRDACGVRRPEGSAVACGYDQQAGCDRGDASCGG